MFSYLTEMWENYLVTQAKKKQCSPCPAAKVVTSGPGCLVWVTHVFQAGELDRYGIAEMGGRARDLQMYGQEAGDITI